MTMLRFAQDRLPYRDREPRGPFAQARYFHMFQLCKYWVKAKGVSGPSTEVLDPPKPLKTQPSSKDRIRIL